MGKRRETKNKKKHGNKRKIKLSRVGAFVAKLETIKT